MVTSSRTGSAHAGAFIISLDFELLWGVRDHSDRSSYGRNVLGAREAIPALLDLFARYGIHATWATVGFLLCESKDELLARAPGCLPTYRNPKLSNYSYFNEVGQNEKSDPYYFGASLVRQIVACPGQEIATHTFSHFYCLEPGQTEVQFRADLAAAMALMRDWSLECRSIVFPRNQFSAAHLAICKPFGLATFRGTENASCYQTSPDAEQSKIRRLTRLADSYFDFTGSNTFRIRSTTPEGLSNAQASRFLRPYARRLGVLEPLRLRRILSALDRAAVCGEIFHLWWHPHNFGVNLIENLRFLDEILAHFSVLRDSNGMRSINMREVLAA